MERILAESPTAQVSLEQLDLADLRSIEPFADRIEARTKQLDLLILNAGVLSLRHRRTAQGFELHFGVNHLGHFVLTCSLLPLVQATTGSRVVVVSSTAATRGAMGFDDLHFENRRFFFWAAYRQSKLANQLFALELQRRLPASGSRVLVTAAHPGWTATDLPRAIPLGGLAGRLTAMQPPQGALPTLRAATDPSATPGDYFGPDGLFQMHGYPTRVPMVKQAQRPVDATRLWEISEDLTGVRYGLPTG